MDSHTNHAPTAATLRPFGWVLTDRHGGTLAHLWRAEPVSSRLDQLRTWSDEAYPDAAPHAWTALLAGAAVPGCPNAVACADAAGCRGLEGCGPAAGTPTLRTAAIAAAIARFDAASPPVEEPAAITVWIGSNAGAPEAYVIRRPAAGVTAAPAPLSELYLSKHTHGNRAGQTVVCELSTGRIVGVVAAGVPAAAPGPNPLYVAGKRALIDLVRVPREAGKDSVWCRARNDQIVGAMRAGSPAPLIDDTSAGVHGTDGGQTR